jgi:hypothetical protein
MPHSRASITSGYNNCSKAEEKRYQYHDLDHVRQRPAAGLSHAVRNSCEAAISPVQAVGVVGWTFVQNGLNYACQIKDDDGKEVYRFAVEVPNGQEYLHRSKELSIAEKAHMLATIEQSLPDHISKQHLNDFFELEKACFVPSLGVVISGPTTPRKILTPQGHVTGYCGLKFANDEISMALLESKKPLQLPEPAILFLEWDNNGKTYSIDCSEMLPKFQMGYTNHPNMIKMNMSKAEAIAAVSYARTKINTTDAELARVSANTGLWITLQFMAEHLSYPPQPV